MVPTPNVAFLKSRSGRGFLVYIVFCAALSALIGIAFFNSSVNSFKKDVGAEKLTVMRLVEAFVATYAGLRTSLGADTAPVPAIFRAHSIEDFNKTRDRENALRLAWVGIPGKEIRVAPADEHSAQVILDLARSSRPMPVTGFHRVDGEVVLRTIYPSIAAQETCVACHNGIQGNRYNWRLNDVMGAFVLDQPFGSYLRYATREAVLVGAGLFVAGALAGFFISLMNYRHQCKSDAIIIELRQRERELSEAQEVADIADRAKSEFLALMSHELRTPLNAINGFSELISAQVLGPVADCYRSYADDIHHSGQNLLAIINDILDLSKAKAGKLTLSEEALDAAVAIETCVRLMRGRADEASLTLATKIEPGVRIVADDLKLKQIVINLLANAVKFTPRGGRIDVTAGVELGSGRFILRVRDSGIGMNETDIPKALAPFVQVDGRLARKYQGAGLGLPLTKALVELHGGTLEIASRPGEGMIVTVAFGAERVIAEARALAS